jgi:hypothetical protein
MTRNGSVFCFRRPLPDREGLDDLPPGLSMLAGMTRAAHVPLPPQMVHQLFFQCTPSLNEQATVNRFVGRANRGRRRAAGGIPPRGNNTARKQLCGLSKARPISCSDSPAFQRLQTSPFSIAESPNRIPGLMPTPPLQRRFTSDGVASTYRMHPTNQANGN